MTTNAPPPSLPRTFDDMDAANLIEARRDPAPLERVRPLMRKYEVSYLTQAGHVAGLARIAPALPAFEMAFASLARGTLIQTERTPVAVEDLLPGDRVATADNKIEPIHWIGSITLVPNTGVQRAEMSTLTRITQDSIGLSRPSPDLMLGPYARLLHRNLAGTIGQLVSARDRIDGFDIVEITPPTPVRIFQIGFARHEAVVANGVAVEALHPGDPAALGLEGEMKSIYLGLFPHLARLDDMGPLRWSRPKLAEDIF
ncbi:Hint domain-containing protein [Aestuariibius insulae]|uniref:Hint domain-containing protein n=1 Tax=Aestuariibius insulae TaxID=2058287 RepID=UPI00345E3B4A